MQKQVPDHPLTVFGVPVIKAAGIPDHVVLLVVKGKVEGVIVNVGRA